MDLASTAADSVAKREAERKVTELHGVGGVNAGGYRFTDPRVKLVSVDDRPQSNSLNQHHRKFFKNDLAANNNNDALANANVADDDETNAAVGASLASHDAAEVSSMLGAASTRLNSMLSTGSEHLRHLVADLEAFRDLDGFGDWRRKEAEDLSQLVQNKLENLQNPKDCRTAKKLVCNLNKGWD